MKYQKLLFALLVLCLPFLAQGQEKTKEYKNEISVNVTSLIGNLLSINDNGAGSPYGLSYRRHGKKRGVRISFDGAYEESDLSNNFNQSIQSTNGYLSLRIGFERIYQLSEKINLICGLDLVGQYENEDSRISNFDFNTGNFSMFRQQDEIITYGGGPTLKFQYILNPRVSFFTESNLYFVMGTDDTFNSDPSIPDSQADIRSFTLTMPVALFVSFAF